ncbi:hypothetical protein L210DRAFT_3765362 [Boletus edulis BED1]|uniref:PIN domain-containing protein n=1 Tax=Boletus edulis BED1 TaxID=1328754 RepID=A0AAD4BF36_BOLED|nr:hypothetical protein L210DRAFT_3765362 [Boletus edulis BED1]
MACCRHGGDICAPCSRLRNGYPPPSSTQRPKGHPRRTTRSTPILNVVSGYSVLVLDTNIILSSLSIVALIIESLRWTVVIPVPVIMELDGLGSNTTQLGGRRLHYLPHPITCHVAQSADVQGRLSHVPQCPGTDAWTISFSRLPSGGRALDRMVCPSQGWCNSVRREQCHRTAENLGQLHF